MIKRGGTRLGTIPNHTLWVWCACGHNGGVPVASILAAPKPPETVADAVAAMRCTRCRARSIKDYVITFQGGSADAMQGARR